MTTSDFLVLQVWLGFFTKISQYTKPYLASLSADGRNATHNTAAARGEAAAGNTKKMTTMKARDRACVWVYFGENWEIKFNSGKMLNNKISYT